MEIVDYIIATDQELVKHCLKGDDVAFEHLFNRYRDSIYQLYISRTGGKVDDSNDLLQETFVKVHLNIAKYSDSYTFGQWIYTIARNNFIDYTRRRRDDIVSIDNIGENSAEMSFRAGQSPEESLIMDQNRDELDMMMNKISLKYRKLIDLRFFKEYSYEEIAKELGLPLGTVKVQIFRAREQLCKLITTHNGKEK